jgi:hypothetical protein
MLKRLGFVGLVVVLGMLVSAVPASTAPGARSASRASAAPQAVTLTNKVTLWGETSIDGPALASITDNFEGVHHITTIGWTGTDTEHHLNLMQSTDNPALGPLHFGNKDTLLDTSIARPAVVQFGGGIGGTAIAWVGTNEGHSLNVVWDAFNSGHGQQRLTLWDESSDDAPALAFFGNNLILAWTGTDPNHSLNVLPISFPGMVPGVKTTLWQFGSIAGPNLSVYALGTGAQLVLTWTTATRHLNLATSTDGVHFTNSLGASGTPQLSAKAPASLFIPAEGGPNYWMGWTGTDPAHYLNLQWSATFPQWPYPASTKTVLADTAFGGPQIVRTEGLLIAWTGTDEEHTLNVALFSGF